MKASKVFLRWYKSFNVNYMNYSDRQHGVVPRPWNSLHVEGGSETDFEFIEIPIEGDITTIVGANESGKSHLLSAISKVIKGTGIPDEWGDGRAFGLTDLCHYASVRSKNSTVWPNIGMEFAGLSNAEQQSVAKAAGAKGASPNFGERACFTLVVAPNSEDAKAFLYIGNGSEPLVLDDAGLTAVRGVLPKVKFIQSKVDISDHVPISNLLVEMGGSAPPSEEYFRFAAAQAAAKFLKGLSLGANSQVSAEVAKELADIKGQLGTKDSGSASAVLETLLFQDVLGVTPTTVEFLARLEDNDRSYAEGLVATWNDEIERTLNLSHYWQQDDLFRLRMNYKKSTIFFEITDKTGAVYTFRERSSGLRFFLSYYIQAKALELVTRDTNCIIIMDEPDSYLSIIGQRNLLSVFESLVSADTSKKNTQLIYTTHSPFLINRNFPRRIRLVRKGDAEEGTQFVDESRLRRYEPVRSALGIDCAQTLFMGLTNVVMEGPTDQFLVSELVRIFATPDNVSDFLDLNSVVLVSADSAPGIEKLLAASRWGDEKNPATVVVVDNDDAGEQCRKRITGQEQHSKELVKDEFVVSIAEAVEAEPEHGVNTTEDLLPASIYGKAVCAYVERWFPEAHKKSGSKVRAAVEDAAFGKNGLVADTKKILDSHAHPGREGYDKMGVLQEVVRLVGELASRADEKASRESVESRVKSFCQKLREKIEASEQAERRMTGKQAVVRVIRDFFIRHKESAGVYDIELVLKRLEREVELLGDDGEPLSNYLRQCLDDVRKLRAANQRRVVDDEWERWKERLMRIRKNPLSPVEELREEIPNNAGGNSVANSAATPTETTVEAGEETAETGSESAASKPR